VITDDALYVHSGKLSSLLRSGNHVSDENRRAGTRRENGVIRTF
jgi:hypothetical protein